MSPSPPHPSATPTGVIAGAATIARDITERNRAEAQIRAYQDEIHRAERLETVGQLAGGGRPRFNNMVGAIIGFTELITTKPTTGPRSSTTPGRSSPPPSAPGA